MIQTFNYNQIELEDSYDQIKTVIIQHMIDDGLIDEKKAEDFCNDHTIILKKKNMFRTIGNKWVKSKESDSFYIHVVSTEETRHKEKKKERGNRNG